ncbi:MAG TPA: MerR family transcriptional regulator [Desulfurobacteriaceae bacterium]|nr:MerR family transcriptional regulator [Desulfurobacteriaceae bacterium]
MIDEKKPVYMIGIVAKLVGVHPQTLRFYEKEGLIKAARTEGQTRLYSEIEFRKIKKIVYLTKEKGVNIAGVKEILKMEEDVYNLLKILKEFLQEETFEKFLDNLKNIHFKSLDIEEIIKKLK